MGSQKLPVWPGWLAYDSDTRLVLVLPSHRIRGPAGQSSVVFVTKHWLHELLAWDKVWIYYHRTFVQSMNIENSKQIFPEKEFPPSICLFCCRKYVDRSLEYIVYIAHIHMHEEIRTEAAQFPEKGIHKLDFHCSVVMVTWRRRTEWHLLSWTLSRIFGSFHSYRQLAKPEYTNLLTSLLLFLLSVYCRT